MKKEIARWDYKDKGGNFLDYVCRFEDGSLKDNSKAAKDIIPYFKPNGVGFKRGLPEAIKEKRPLYGLESLRTDLGALDEPLYIVEGEKGAAALISLGFQVVTSLGGCEAVHKADWEALIYINRVVILPDNDEAGNRYAKTVYKRLKALKKPPIDISIASLPDLPIGGDMCDFLIRNFEALYKWGGFSPISEIPYSDSIGPALISDLESYSGPVPLSWQAIASSKGLYLDGEMQASLMRDRLPMA